MFLRDGYCQQVLRASCRTLHDDREVWRGYIDGTMEGKQRGRRRPLFGRRSLSIRRLLIGGRALIMGRLWRRPSFKRRLARRALIVRRLVRRPLLKRTLRQRRPQIARILQIRGRPLIKRNTPWSRPQIARRLQLKRRPQIARRLQIEWRPRLARGAGLGRGAHGCDWTDLFVCLTCIKKEVCACRKRVLNQQKKELD